MGDIALFAGDQTRNDSKLFLEVVLPHVFDLRGHFMVVGVYNLTLLRSTTIV